MSINSDKSICILDYKQFEARIKNNKKAYIFNIKNHKTENHITSPIKEGWRKGSFIFI